MQISFSGAYTTSKAQNRPVSSPIRFGAVIDDGPAAFIGTIIKTGLSGWFTLQTLQDHLAVIGYDRPVDAAFLQAVATSPSGNITYLERDGNRWRLARAEDRVAATQ